MQRLGTFGRKIIHIIIAIVSVAFLIFLDRLTKKLFTDLYNNNGGNTDFIKGFFYFSYSLNSGSAYGLFSDKSWGQSFFQLLTPVALVAFSFLLWYGIKKNYKVLFIAFLFIIAGTYGNYIDRIISGAVTDFLVIEIGGKQIFGVFNLADVFITVGAIMVFVHILFLDKSLRKKDENGKV